MPVQPSGSSVCVSLSSNCMKQWLSKGECSGNLSAAIGKGKQQRVQGKQLDWIRADALSDAHPADERRYFRHCVL